MVKAIDKIKEWAKENVRLISILPENDNLQVDTRLKDVLETSVDEKYYLSDEKTGALLAELEKKDKVTGTVGHHPFSKKFEFSGYNSEVSPTLLATDYKAPKTVLEEQSPIVAGSLEHYGNDQMNRVYHTHGIAPTITVVSGGGREQKIAEEVPLQQYTDGEGISYNVDANYAKGTSVGDIGKGRRTRVLESEMAVPVLTPDRANKRQNGRRFKEDGEPMFTLTSQDKHGVLIEQLDEITKKSRPNDKIEYTFKENGDIRPHRMDARKSGISELNINHEENPSHTVTTSHAPKVYGESTKYRIRKLTPHECWRLQGFPDWAFNEAQAVNSDSQLYKQAGNSVTVNVIHEIAKRLEKSKK